MSPELVRFLQREWYGVDSILKLTPLLGRTALHGATEEKPVELVRELMCEMGDLVHHRDYNGATALHYACSIGNVDVVALLATYIDQTVQDNIGWTALHDACAYNPRVVPLLKWHEILNGDDEPPCTNRSHIHTLAKLRRLLGTLPAAYIRLVHSFA